MKRSLVGLCSALCLAAWGILPGTQAEGPRKGNERSALDEFTQTVRCLALSPDGKTLAVGGGDWRGPGELLLLRVATGEKVWYSSGFRLSVWAVAFSPDGKTLAAGTDQGDLSLWDVAKGEKVTDLKGHRGCLRSLAFAGNTALVSQSWDNWVLVWDLGAKKPKATFKFPFREQHKDELHPATEERPDPAAKLAVKFETPVTGLLSVAVSPDGSRLAAAAQDKAVPIWDSATGKQAKALVTDHEDCVCRVAFSYDGKLLATAGALGDGSVRIWDFKTHKRLAVLEGHTDAVHALAFTRDGKKFVTASGDETVRVWDVGKQKELYSVRPRKDCSPSAVVISPDGKWFVVAGGPNSVKRYALADGKELPFGK